MTGRRGKSQCSPALVTPDWGNPRPRLGSTLETTTHEGIPLQNVTARHRLEILYIHLPVLSICGLTLLRRRHMSY
jgi:hypothetical protein